MQTFNTPEEVFLYLSEKYGELEGLPDCNADYLSRFICVSILGMAGKTISNTLASECLHLMKDNKPTDDHWATKSKDWANREGWWWLTRDAQDIKQVFQDKSRFLKELAELITPPKDEKSRAFLCD